MLYNYIDVNPFMLVMGIMPAVSAIVGILVMIISKRIYLAPAIAFFLPLLFITTNRETFLANIDAWFLWGAIYGLIAYFVGKLMKK
ncbi:hypothetical protein SRRS_46380 [Sporomusa rhizae]|uniref:hypothetical protein n=1 Tax=Sporomusa rhizae TaxID=357999 RepID=UPI00352A2541